MQETDETENCYILLTRVNFLNSLWVKLYEVAAIQSSA